MDTYFEEYKQRLEGKLVCLGRERLTCDMPSVGLVVEMIPILHPYKKKPIHRAGAKVLWSNGTVSCVTCSSLVTHLDITAGT